MELTGSSRPVGRSFIEQARQRPLPFNRFSSDSLVYATPFLTFACCQVGLQGRPEPAVPIQSGEIIWSSLLHLRLSFRVCLHRAGFRGSNISTGHQSLLLWDSRCLPADISLLASTPAAPEGTASTACHHSRLHVPSSWFLTTSTVCSASEP